MKAWLVAGALAFGALDAQAFWPADIRIMKPDGFSATNSIDRIGIATFLSAVSPEPLPTGDGGGAPGRRAKAPDAQATEASGAAVHEDSCAALSEEPAVFTVCSDPDKVEIRADHEATLRRSLELLRTCPKAIAHIEGHGDRGVVREYNLALSERRAASVVSRLKAGGIYAARLSEVSGKGDHIMVIGTPEERQECSRGTTITVLVR